MLSIASHERDLVRWRPSYVVSHVDLPVYDERTTRVTYTKILTRLPRAAQGVWVLKDVHIVDANVAELMAWIKHRWYQGKMHLVLLSPTPDAGMQWATYIGCIKPAMVPSVVLEARVGRRLIANMPTATVVQLSNWIQEQSLKGDVLVFARSATHRDVMCEAWACCNLQVPVQKVETHLPYHTGAPRVLVGTPTLDYMLDTVMARRIQHVIDFGRVYRLRQETGNDWEEDFITLSMAEARATIAQSSAPGLCLRVYASEGSLSTDTFATHKLSHALCRARLMIRCGTQALDRFPVALQPGHMDPSVARLMVRLNVEKSIATILHVAPSLDLGIGIAAIIGRHTGPYVKNHYEACVQGSMPPSTMKHVNAWASILGRSPKKIVQAVCHTTWTDVLPLIFQGYQDTIAVTVGKRKEYIDVRTGDILYCRFGFLSCGDTEAIIYTHRQESRILSSLPIPLSWVTNTLQRTTAHSPVRLGNDVLVLAMQAWFETKRVMAWRVSPTEVELVCGAQVNLSTVLEEWTDTMHRKALDIPLVVPLGTRNSSMSMVFTAGMRFSDAVTASDFLVMKCELETLTTAELLFLHKTPGLWSQDTVPSMILGTRKEAEGLWDHMENVMVRALGTEYQRFQPSQVVVRLVVKVYRGKSTGRAVIQGGADKEWLSRVDPAWQWEVHEDVDLVSLYSRNATAAATVCNIPEHMDEIDIAALLHMHPRHILLERTVQLLTQLPCVIRFFRAVGSDNVMKATRALRYTEFYMDIGETNLERTLRLVYDLLPMTNDVVNQPLRVHWSLLTTTGSHPSALIARTPTTVISVARHDFAKELVAVRAGLESATRLATHCTPSLSWYPSLAVPWVDVALPLVEGSGGPLFRLYGSEEDKEVSREALRRLADDLPEPAPGTYGVCPICIEPMASYALSICGCRFCPPCIAQAFDTKCMDDAFFGELQCPTCQERVSTEDLSLFLRPKALLTYATRIATFLSSRIPDVIRECPAKCGFFGRVRATPHQQSFDCRQCNTSWCIRCSEKAGTAVASHQGFCDKRWDSDYWKAFAEEAALAGARPCPQCGTYVAKDGGCSHVSCTAPNCHTHFCWKCAQAFSHVQLSPPAQGVIQTIQGNLVTISVEQQTWKTPCHTAAPKIVTYKAEHARSMLLENEAFEPRARLWVYSYIYDHLDACACT